MTGVTLRGRDRNGFRAPLAGRACCPSMKLRLPAAMLLCASLTLCVATPVRAACTIDALGSLAASSRLRDVEIVGTTAYIAAGTGGLLIVDVTTPASPTLLGSTPARGYAQDVEVVGSIAYVAESDYVGSGGLRIIDVSSPATPIELGATGTSFTRVEAAGTLLYATDPERGLRVIDVSLPTLPFEIGSFDGPGRETAISLDGTLAYLTVDEGAASVLATLDVSLPSNPVEVGSALTAGRIPVAVDAAPGLAYIAAVGGDQRGLVITDTSVPTSPVQESFLFTEPARDVALAAGRIYLSAGFDPTFGGPSGSLTVIDVTSPDGPVPIGSIDAGTQEIAALTVAPGAMEDFVYAAVNGPAPGLQIYRVTACPDTLRSRVEQPGGGELVPVSTTTAIEFVIYGSATQSVAGIDTGAITVGPPGATQSATPVSGPTITDVDMDGHDDLVLEFAANALGLAGADQQACIESTLSGQAFVACDFVEPNEPPVKFANVDPLLGYAPQEVDLSARHSFDPEDGPLTFEWLFDDLVLLTGDNQERVYTDPGDYSVTLTITDDTGQTAVETWFFTVEPPIPMPSVSGGGLVALVGVLLGAGVRRGREARGSGRVSGDRTGS